MPQSLTGLYCHFIFSTKNRTPEIQSEWQGRLHEYLGGILRAQGSCLLSAGGTPDHIHLLVSLSKQQSVSECLRILKSNSSGWIHETFSNAKNFSWQAGYAAFSVSYSDLNEVKHYIQTQEEHHRKRTFKEELIAFLKANNIDYDERYLWE